MKKNYVLAAALSTYLICGNAKAEDVVEEEKKVTVEKRVEKKGVGFVEVLGGYPASSLDVIVHTEATDRLTLTARGRLAVNYPLGGVPSVSPFVLGAARFNVVDHLNLRLEGYCVPGACRPSAGVEYSGSIGPLHLFGFATMGLKADVDVEFVFVGSYMPKIDDRFGLYFALETATNLGKNGHTFSVQRPRVGLAIDRFQFGVGADLLEVGNNPVPVYNIGAFASGGF